MGDRILRPGTNCWRIARARRATFLVDAAAYFQAFRAAVRNARRSVLIAGWDIDSRVRLVRDASYDGLPAGLADFLNAVLRRRPEVDVHILAWDYAMVYAFEREWLPLRKLSWGTHRRLHIHMDGAHPIEASHHQKIVVVDDEIGFAGGIDLCRERWDTPVHAIDDPRRTDPSDEPFPPRHDVQMAVTGDAARSLAEIFRERWRRSTGRQIPAPGRGSADDIWPLARPPDLENIDVGIARTGPAYNGLPEVREAERLYLDSIRAARCSLFFEHQYLTAERVGEALAARLREPDGPEVVVVSPSRASGWLEQQTMDALRARLLDKLRGADGRRRMRIYSPFVLGSRREPIHVHSKVTVVDDEFARVGSSNLSNRSMGVDTECDLAVEAGGDAGAGQAIAGLRNRLLAEHLGVEPDTFAETAAREGSLIGAIEALRGGRRSLDPLDSQSVQVPESIVPELGLFDSDRPIDPDRAADRLLPKEERRPVSGRLLVAASALVVFLALAAAWRWTPLKEWLDVTEIASRIDRFRGTAVAPLLVAAGFTVAGLLVIPVTACIVATMLAFGPGPGVAYSLLGAACSAFLTYVVGRSLGRDSVGRLGGSRVGRAARRLSRGGILTVVAVRMIPVAPYTLINVVAGAIRYRFRDYALGTIIGMLPGTAVLAVLVDNLEMAIRDPQPTTFLAFGAASAAGAVTLLAIRAWLRRR